MNFCWRKVMTKKDYKTIADILKKAFNLVYLHRLDNDFEEWFKKYLTNEFIIYFEEENDKFNKEKFIEYLNREE